MSDNIFCTKCGASIGKSDIFCVKCGTKKIISNHENVQTYPNLEKFGKAWSVIIIIIGVGVLLGGAYFSNVYNMIMGIVLFIIGFVNLKTKSKTIQQLIWIISLIITAISIINLAK